MNEHETYEQQEVTEALDARSGHGATEAAAIASWRLGFALSLGFTQDKAEEISTIDTFGLDMHAIGNLVAKGCSPELALEILL